MNYVLPRMLPLFLVACGSEDPSLEPAQVTILVPTDGGTVAAGDVPVSLVVDHFTLVTPETAHVKPVLAPWPLRALVAEARAHNEEGVPEGFVHLVLDGTSEQDISRTQASFASVAAGAHTLSATLRYADGDELEPSVTASVSFTAE